jgi:hypothetical protein
MVDAYLDTANIKKNACENNIVTFKRICLSNTSTPSTVSNANFTSIFESEKQIQQDPELQFYAGNKIILTMMI